jgi:hypothetical protein
MSVSAPDAVLKMDANNMAAPTPRQFFPEMHFAPFTFPDLLLAVNTNWVYYVLSVRPLGGCGVTSSPHYHLV